MLLDGLTHAVEVEGLRRAIGAGTAEQFEGWTCPGFVDGYGLGFQALCGSCLLS